MKRDLSLNQQFIAHYYETMVFSAGRLTKKTKTKDEAYKM